MTKHTDAHVEKSHSHSSHEKASEKASEKEKTEEIAKPTRAENEAARVETETAHVAQLGVAQRRVAELEAFILMSIKTANFNFTDATAVLAKKEEPAPVPAPDAAAVK